MPCFDWPEQLNSAGSHIENDVDTSVDVEIARESEDESGVDRILRDARRTIADCPSSVTPSPSMRKTGRNSKTTTSYTNANAGATNVSVTDDSFGDAREPGDATASSSSSCVSAGGYARSAPSTAWSVEMSARGELSADAASPAASASASASASSSRSQAGDGDGSRATGR